jgi:hypothetical protein
MTQVYTPEQYPHGLMCPDCRHVFEDGERIGHRLCSAVEELNARIPRYEGYETAEGPVDTRDIPAVMIVCTTCAAKALP